MDLSTLAKRARLQRVQDRAEALDALREMYDGTYQPTNGDFMPRFTPGTARHAAFLRSLRTTSTIVPVVIHKALAAIDFGSITWSDAEGGKVKAAEVDDRVGALPLARIARDLAIEHEMGGAMAALASTPLDPDGRAMDPTIDVLHGVNIPYADPIAPGRVTGWYRAIEYPDDTHGSQLRWWVEAYEFLDDARTFHRVWRSLVSPTDLAIRPDDEYESTARPRFYVGASQPDGLPVSPMLANLGRVLGLYASELRLATTEELAAFPMLLTVGDADVAQVGPAEVIAVGEDGDARWLDPGKLDELRAQVSLKRDQIREAFSLPGGALGNDTPSGEALMEANRAFMQRSRALADALSGVLTEVVSDYLALWNLPPVDVTVPIDRAYTTSSLLEVVEKGVDLGALPDSVAARMFQAFLGSHYSDEELQAFLAEKADRRSFVTPGFLPRNEETPDEGEAAEDAPASMTDAEDDPEDRG